MNIETAQVATLISENFLLRDLEAGIPVHVEEEMKKLVTKMINASQKGVHNRLSAALKNLVVCTVQRLGDSLEFISRLSDSVID